MFGVRLVEGFCFPCGNFFHIHTPVGELQKELGRAHVNRLFHEHFRTGGKGPHTDGYLQIFLAYAVSELKAAFHLPNALGDIHAVSQGAIEYGDKFISAESDGKLIVIQFLQKLLRKFDKYLIACHMPIAVI